MKHAFGLLKALRLSNGGWRFPINTSVNAESANALDCAFVLEPVDLEFQLLQMTPSEAKVIRGVTTCGDGPSLSRLKLSPGYFGQSGSEAETFGGLLGALVGAHGNPTHKLPALSTRLAAVFNPAPIGRLCSALVETRTVDATALSIDAPESFDDIVPALWGYVAYAFFSKHARAHSSISRLALSDVVLDRDAAEAVATVLQADDPVIHLYGQSRDFDGNEAPTIPPVAAPTTRMMLMQGATVTFQ